MVVIPTHWDDASLGVKSFEIDLAHDDDIDGFLAMDARLASEGAQYIVAKVDVCRPEFLYTLPEHGYTFVESGISLITRREQFNVPGHLQRFTGASTNPLDDQINIENTLREIADGMFDTDRISMNPHFSRKQVGIRYRNWVEFILSQGDKIQEVVFKNKAIGFFILESINRDECRGVLTGLYSRYANSGLGPILMRCLFDTVWNFGYSLYHAQVVSNNPKALRANLMFGSEIHTIKYHFVKNFSHDRP